MINKDEYYESKPHTIRAFCFKGCDTKWQQWFLDAAINNRVSVTVSDKEAYITIYYEDGGIRKAEPGHWVCTNASGTIFPMTHEEFERGFKHGIQA